MKRIILFIFTACLLSSTYAQSDLEIINFVNPNNNPLTDLTLGQNDPVAARIWVKNNGPATLPSGTVLTYRYYVNEDTIFVGDDELGQDLPADGSIYLTVPTLSANILTEHELGEYFDLCLRLYVTADSVNQSNNSKCLTILRETSIDDVTDSPISIFPNPTSDYLFIQNAAHASIRLYDMNGKELLSFENADNHCRIPIERLSAGIYFVKISHHNNIITQKISITK